MLIIIAAGAGFVVWRLKPASQMQKALHVTIVTRKGVATYDQAIESYRKKMKELGHIEGESIMHTLSPFSDMAELGRVVQDAIASRPDVIVTYSTPATVEVYRQTKDMPNPIPVVFGSVGDPVAAGVVNDAQKLGTNVTGVTSLSTELTANRLRLLKQINPSIKRVAMPRSIVSLGDSAANKSVDIAEESARELGITLIFFPISSSEDNLIAAKQITRAKVDGMIVGGDSLVWGGIDAYIAQSIKEKIPFAAFDVIQIMKGALVGIGPDYSRVGEQVALLTHQILRGAKPGDIAVQIPEKLILAVNVATARAIGITLSDALLKQADVIVGK